MCARARGGIVSDTLRPGDAAMSRDNVPIHSGLLVGLSAACMLALSACQGGDATNPPVDDAVASVAVSPAAPPLVEGDSVQLSATPKNASGATLSSKTIAWSSSAANVATVSSKGVVTGVKQGSVTITATVDGTSGTLGLVVGKGAPLVLETARAANDSIGPAGGTITSTGTNGIVYTLTVPPNALRTPRRITMTPVKAIRTLPMSGGVLGAIDLEPAGLHFTKPVRLKIAAATTPPAGKHLVGFSFEQQGDSLGLEVVADSGSSATVLLSHFSGGGAVFGSTSDIAAFVQNSINSSNANITFIDSLLVLSMLSPRDFNAELQVLRTWFNQHIIPEIQLAQNDSALGVAIIDYNIAIATQLAFGISAASALGPEKAAAAAAIAPKLRQAIQDENSVCKQQRSIEAAANALFWQTQATDFGVDTPAEQLDRTTVLFDLCIQVAYTQSDFPDPAVAGQQGTLAVRAGLQFGSQPNLALELFTWKVTTTGSTSDGTQQGNSDTSGGFTLLFTPTGQVSLSMQVRMCLFDNQVPYLDVCASRMVTRQFGVTLNGSQLILTQAGLQSLSNVTKIVGDLTIQPGLGETFTTTDLRELSQLKEVTGNVRVFNVPSLQRLDGLHSLTTVGGFLSFQNDRQLADMSGLSSMTSLGGLNLRADSSITAITGLNAVTSLDVSGLNLSHLPVLANIGGLSGLRSARNLLLDSLAVLSSLQALRGTKFRDLIFIRGMGSLTTIRDLTGIDSAFSGGINLSANPVLTDFSILSSLKTVGGIGIASDVIGNLSFLSGLRLAAGAVIFSGAGLAEIALPSLEHAGSVNVLLDSPSLTTVSFPSLQDAGVGGSAGVVLGGNIACGSGHVSLLLPALRSVGTLSAGNGEFQLPNCSITVSAPNLTTASSGVAFSGGVTGFTLQAPLTTPQFSIGFTSVTSIDLPLLNTQILAISSNLQLTTLGTGSGSVTNRLIIMFNLNLLQSDALAYANRFSPHGTLFVSGNKP